MGTLHNRPTRLERRRELRKDSTLPEQRLWQCLRGNQLGVKFRRQHSIGNYIVDFFAAEAKLVIEVDGDSHYANHAASVHDQIRDQFLLSLGLTIVRITNNDVMTNREGVLQHILAVIARSPPPQPSP